MSVETPMNGAWPRIARIADREQLAAVEGEMRADGHAPLALTHLATKGGQIVGAASVGGVPLLHLWAHTQRMRPRDSFFCLNALEAGLALAGQRQVLVPCTESSPFFPAMTRMGYTDLGPFHLFAKCL